MQSVLTKNFAAYFVLAVIALASVLLGVGTISTINEQIAEASTDFSNYNSARITTAISSSTAGVRLSGPATFGSVVVLVPSPASSTRATALGFYDGTAKATSSATLLFTVPTTTPAGTYTFDVRVNNGLIVDVPKGYKGQAVVTTRL
jgi:hypothetical protein